MDIDLLTPPHPDFRAGMVAVVGAANAGKSSLINHILGEKVSIVSSVAQTTRNLVRAIYTNDDGQAVFLDTPGMHKAQGQLGQFMNKIARASTDDVDVVVLVLDRSIRPAMVVEGWMRRLAKESMPVLFVLNKCDRDRNRRVVYEELWSHVQEEEGGQLEPLWIEVSAETGEGVDALLSTLLSHLPLGPMLFPEDMLTDFPKKLNIADVVREKYFKRLSQEVPHSLAVWVEHLDEQEHEWKAEVHVYVRTPSQKGIVIGAKGRVMKAVRAEAEKELSDMYERRVKVRITVKVEKDWDKNFWMLRKLGYA